MKLVGLVALMLAGPAAQQVPHIPPASIDDTLEVVGESLEARQVRTRMTTNVTVNGAGPFRFLIDSGADRSVIGANLAARLGLPAGPVVGLQSMAGRSDVPTVRIGSLRVGSSEVRNMVAPALSERHLGAQGMIGIDALAEQRLAIDFADETITIQDPRTRERVPRGSEDIIVTARRRGGQLILTEVRYDKGRLFAVIDTGAQVTIGNMALHARIFGRRNPPEAYPVELTSVTGQTITATMALLPLLQVGTLTLRNVPVAFADVPPFALFGLDRQPALLLGTDTLQAFRRISLDFRNRKVRFILRSSPGSLGSH